MMSDVTSPQEAYNSHTHNYVIGPGTMKVEIRRTDLLKNYPQVLAVGNAQRKLERDERGGIPAEVQNHANDSDHVQSGIDTGSIYKLLSGVGSIQNPISGMLPSRVSHVTCHLDARCNFDGTQEYLGPTANSHSVKEYCEGAGFIWIYNDTGASVEVAIWAMSQFAIPLTEQYASVNEHNEETYDRYPPSIVRASSYAGGSSLRESHMNALVEGASHASSAATSGGKAVLQSFGPHAAASATNVVVQPKKARNMVDHANSLLDTLTGAKAQKALKFGKDAVGFGMDAAGLASAVAERNPFGAIASGVGMVGDVGNLVKDVQRGGLSAALSIPYDMMKSGLGMSGSGMNPLQLLTAF
jgi:hypothetical protein